MANITHATLETDLRLAAMLEREINLLLTDTANLRNSGAITFHGDVAGLGSDTLRVRLAGLDGYDSMTATAAEDTDVADTSPTDASADIAVVRAALRYDIGDLAALTGFPGSDLDPVRLAQSMTGAFEQYFNSLVGGALSSLTGSVGGSGVNMTVANFFEAMAVLEVASVPGPYTMVLFPQQLADLQSALRSESGVIEHLAGGDLVGIKGPGFSGSYLGVDIWVSSDVPAANAGADSNGAMWGQGALGYAIGTPRPLMGAGGEVRPAGTPVVVEFQRDASSALTEIVGHAYCGLSVIEADRGCQIVTDR
jgi:hypothetical protein